MQRREVNPAGEHAAGSAGGPAPDGGNVLGPACLGAEAIDALAGGAPLELLLPRVYDDVPAALHGVAARSLLAHLLKLEQDGAARQQAGAWWGS